MSTILGGRYELGRTLGRGGMAEVRRAKDLRLGRDVAVKQLRVDLATDPTFQARFRREAQSAAGLNHPNIVAVYDTGEQADENTGIEIPYIVMELVEGQTLREILRSGRKILPERALEITQGVLDALAYSHRAGIVHRDIKPANVMLTPQGTVKVMDFGIARAVADTSATMTQTAAVIGTAQYLSPEQARGEAVDNRSDLYSAGCLLYELLTGRPPFVGDSPVSVAYQHVRELPVPPSQLDTLVTPEMDKIVLTALAKDPADRYQSAREFRDDIGRLLAGQAVTAVLPSSAAAMVVPTAIGPTHLLTPSTQMFDSPAPRETPPPSPVPMEDEDEDDEEEPRRTGLWVLIGALTVIVVGLAAWGLLYLMNPNEKPSATPSVVLVQVPDVTGRAPSVAESNLEKQGFTVKTNEVVGEDDNTVNTVTDQDPTGGSEAPQGSEVTITVNVGPKKGTIPDGLVGEDKDAVEKSLKKAGFTNISLKAASSEPATADKDEVLSIDPAEGSEASLDTQITVTYATGKTKVPDWRGWTQDAVATDAESKGLTVRFVEEDSSSPAGTVTKMSPKQGTQIEKSATITVTIAKAQPQETPTPTPEPSDTPSPSPTPGVTPTG